MMNKPIVSNHVTADQLLRIIESIVFTGPIREEELKAHLKFTIHYTPEPDVLDSTLNYLQEKYSHYLYGIGFFRQAGKLEFKGRSVKEILNH
jgi:hypothetical protein